MPKESFKTTGIIAFRGKPLALPLFSDWQKAKHGDLEVAGAEEVPIGTDAFEELNYLCKTVDDASGTIPKVLVQRPLLRVFLNKHGIHSRACLGIFSMSEFQNELTQIGLKACSEFCTNPITDDYKIGTLKTNKVCLCFYFLKACKNSKIR